MNGITCLKSAILMMLEGMSSQHTSSDSAISQPPTQSQSSARGLWGSNWQVLIAFVSYTILKSLIAIQLEYISYALITHV